MTARATVRLVPLLVLAACTAPAVSRTDAPSPAQTPAQAPAPAPTPTPAPVLAPVLAPVPAGTAADSPASGVPPAVDPRVHAIVDGASAARIEADIRRVADFGTRHTMSDTVSATRGIGAARRWLRQELEAISGACGRCLEVGYVE
jgi:hypothetical protein